MTHLFKIPLIEVVSLLGDEVCEERRLLLQFLCAHFEELLGLPALLLELGVHGVLVQTVDKLDEVGLEEVKMLRHCDLEGLERL